MNHMASPDNTFPHALPCRAPTDAPTEGRRRVLHHRDPAMPEGGHRTASVAALAARFVPFLADMPANAPGPPGLRTGAYVVPDSTLLIPEAMALGVIGEGDLFGGVVPHKVVAGKAITHLLPGADSPHPEGWSWGFASDVADHTLQGLAAFTLEDARVAIERLLPRGPVRLKPAWADGGGAQQIIHELSAIDAALGELDAGHLAEGGVVAEQNLEEALTFSVGRLRIGTHALAYVGTQGTTRDNEGRIAYGGSRLHVVRGGFAELIAAPFPEQLRRAAGHARAYDEAADRRFPGFFASRRNYDVVLGRDAAGASHVGVLEQSWRIGGASGAEIVALEAFANDAALNSVVASCHEVYGPAANPPAEALVYYHADDPQVGHLTKYALIEARSHA